MKKKLQMHLSVLEARSWKLAASSAGFGLIELIIAMVIFGIVTVFMLISYSRVGGNLYLSTLAYEVALSFREAQSFGVSVREFRGTVEDDESGTFDAAYGLHFDYSPSVDATKTTFAMFADAGGLAGNGQLNDRFGSSYDTTGCLTSIECLSVFKLEKGNRIAKFCGVLLGDGGRDAPDSEKQEECNVDSLPASNGNIDTLDVTFLRPNPDAIIKTSRSVQSAQYKAARVYLESPTNLRKIVEVVTTGQISIK